MRRVNCAHQYQGQSPYLAERTDERMVVVPMHPTGISDNVTSPLPSDDIIDVEPNDINGLDDETT